MERTVLLVGLNHTLQFRESEGASFLEAQQRRKFLARFGELIASFEPDLFADESPDTSHQGLLALCFPRVCIDIPHEQKLVERLYVGRDEKTLCPYVDGRREQYWKARIDDEVGRRSCSRVLMTCGSNHLYAFPAKPLSFPALLSGSGYLVECVDLRKESWWDESWVRDYRDPEPRPGVVVAECCLALGFDKCRWLSDDAPTGQAFTS